MPGIKLTELLSLQPAPVPKSQRLCNSTAQAVVRLFYPSGLSENHTSSNSIYVGGVTQSTDFPIVMGYDDSANASGQPDGFIARLSSDLTTVLSSTYFGTEYFDRVTAIALDSDGTIVATDQAGYGFPLTNGAYNYSGSEPTGGGFIARFSSDLSTLMASAVVTTSDYPTEITLGNGAVYFAGRTNNPDFPITDNAPLKTCCPVIGGYGLRGFDNCVGKISSDLTNLQTLTFAGGATGTQIDTDAFISLFDTSCICDIKGSKSLVKLLVCITRIV